MDALDALVRDRFGFPGFRPGQREIVAHAAAGGDALVVMPTGAGKSLCYQVPALARGGTAIVVSPLIALMKDQVDGLLEHGIKATFLNSSLAAAEYKARSAALAAGAFELAYVAPERFTPAFLDFLKRVDVRLLAIDEAHCLSQWGHDFRPDYLRLGHVRQAMGFPPTIALTATATPEVQKDIVSTLRIEKGRTFIRGFDRENLVLEVLGVGSQVEKDGLLADLVTPGPALVYCATRKNVERATEALRTAGVRTGMYHAGLAQEDRTRVQDDFMDGKIPVVVATNAFGMGIDKRDIRAIVHYDMPGTVEAYYQEIGRAGRDGRMSRAVLLHHPIDRRIHEFFIDGAHPPADWVHRLWAWLLSRGDNPVFARVEDMASALPAEGADRAASACLSVLIREGRARRIAPNDRSAWLKIEQRPPAPIPGNAGKVWSLVEDRQLEPGDSLDFHVDRWAADAGLNREQLVASLARLEERGLLRYRPADRIGGVELLDVATPLKLDESGMRQRRGKAYRKLDKMEAYTGPCCRRRYVVEYFGEVAAFESCGTCDACRMGEALDHEVVRPLTPDETTVVLKILSCVARMDRHAGKQGWGIDLVAKVLIGSKEEKVARWGFDKVTTWGLLSAWSAGEVADVVVATAAAGLLAEDYATREIGGRQKTYKEVRLTPEGWAALRREGPDLKLAFPHARKLVRVSKAPPARRVPSGVRTDLLASLRDVRRQLAEASDVPAYVIASNRTLEELARQRPTTRRAMLNVHGMGPVRFEKFGQQLIEVIKQFDQSV